MPLHEPVKGAFGQVTGTGTVAADGKVTVRDQARPVSFDAAVSAAGAGEVGLSRPGHG